jgi:hypothetical protein
MADAVLLIGAPGAGKSATLDALATQLEIDGVAHGALESEELSRGWPLLAAEEWLAQLDVVLARQRAAGRALFLVAATVEDERELRAAREACACERVLVVCLSAAPDLAAGRVAEREPERWPGREQLIAHARRLAVTVPLLAGIDLVIDTAAGTPDDVATAIRGAMRGRGLCP